jgi:AcrR family transcriptional regulator
MSHRDSILESSVKLLQQNGLDGWSIQGIAARTGCAKALVIHHYKTRHALLEASAEQVRQTRLDRRLTAVAVGGTRGLDRLWDEMVDGVHSGLARAAIALASHDYGRSPDVDRRDLHRAVARCLGIDAELLAEPTALTAMLDGIELQLLQGVGTAAVRSAFDRLWLTMVDG